jgi:hypothetical protein
MTVVTAIVAIIHLGLAIGAIALPEGLSRGPRWSIVVVESFTFVVLCGVAGGWF